VTARPPPHDGPASYSTADVARRLGVSVPTVQRWVDLGHLKAWKTVGGHRRIEAESAERLFREQQSTAPTAPAPLAAMVVDDNPDDRDLLSALLDHALPGVAVSLHDNGFQALVAIGQAVPDVLVTDIAMPHMDGLEMLRQLASRCPVRPRVIVAVSSQTPGQLSKRGGLPADLRFVPKPIDPAVFIETVREALGDSAPPVTVGTTR
jgi:excisionase family DNA binding protein